MIPPSRHSRANWPGSGLGHHLAGKSPSANHAGIALIIVMISIFVLAMLAGGFAMAMKVEMKLARNASSEAELEWLGRSAVECARWELAQFLLIREITWDSLDQPWAGGTSYFGLTNSPLLDFKHEIQTPRGIATWRTVDLDRRFNINIADGMILQNALMVMGVDAGQMTPIINSIRDWIDVDNAPNLEGAESEEYQRYTPPYYAKNGPLDDISELRLIKGITPEMYFGGVPTNDLSHGFDRQAGRFNRRDPNMIGYPVGLTNLFTAFAWGKVNVNTAPAEVLQLIPSVTPEVAQAIVDARAGEPDGSGLVGPYRNIGEVRRVPEVNPAMAATIARFADVRSKIFEVHATATVNGYTRHFIGLLARNTPRDVQILKFYWTESQEN